MYPKLFGQDFLNTYGLCIGVGVIMCLYFLHFACKRLRIPSQFEDFVTYNAVISVGGANNYGLPSTEMLARLATASPAHNLYRTDVHGTISVYVSNDGEIRVQTDYKENWYVEKIVFNFFVIFYTNKEEKL